MPQSETSHAGPSVMTHAQWHRWLPCLARASAASAGGTPAAGCHVNAHPVFDKLMRESQ